MNYLITNLTIFQVAAYAAAGFLLYLVFSFVGRYVIPFFQKNMPLVFPLWQKIQIISWMAYLILFYSALLNYFTAMTLIVTVLIIGLGWEYWRNMAAGVLIKFNNQLRVGDFISTDLFHGSIKAIHLAGSELISEKGELVIVPNNKLRNTVVTHRHKSQDVNICVFNVEQRNRDLSLDDIYQLAYNCPYISANQEISIEKAVGNECVIKATVIDNSFTESAQKYFEDHLSTGSEVPKDSELPVPLPSQ